MAYKRRVVRFKNAIEVEDFHNARYGAPGEKRHRKKQATPEQVEKQNQYHREKIARYKLRENFDVHDYYTTLTYRKDLRPADMEEAKKHWRRAQQKIRREYKRRGYDLKWMMNIEVGSRGAWHIHLVVNRIPDTDVIIAKAWPYGGVHHQLLYERGEFAHLAKYITKTPKTDKRLRESSYSASRNLKMPKVEETIHYTWKITDKIRVPKGWYLDPESLHEGVNPVTGYPYRTFTLLRMHRIPSGDGGAKDGRKRNGKGGGKCGWRKGKYTESGTTGRPIVRATGKCGW